MTFEFNPDPALKVWRSEGRHLPEALRDFHAQKSLFKAIEKAYGRMKLPLQKEGSAALDWVSAHCFSLDYFLWFMAAHGYTLQRSRSALPFSKLEHSILALNQTNLLGSPRVDGSLEGEDSESLYSKLQEILQGHLHWCPQVWTSQPGEKTSDFRSLSIATLGLIGEAGELVDSLKSDDKLNQLKEAGDVLYYWCVLCDAYALDAKLLSHKGLEAMSRKILGVHDSRKSAFFQESLLLQGSTLSEIFKKFIRDLNCQVPEDKAHSFWVKLNRCMSEFFESYCELLSVNSLSLHDVCSANKSKLLDRRARGVTRGDGDNR